MSIPPEGSAIDHDGVLQSIRSPREGLRSIDDERGRVVLLSMSPYMAPSPRDPTWGHCPCLGLIIKGIAPLRGS